MKNTFASFLVITGFFMNAAQAKTCRWSGGHELFKDVTFELNVNQKSMEIAKCASQDLTINGKWKFKREFKAKDGTDWLEFRFPKDKYIQGIVDPRLLKVKGSGLLKLWYNNGDGFISSVYLCE